MIPATRTGIPLAVFFGISMLTGGNLRAESIPDLTRLLKAQSAEANFDAALETANRLVGECEKQFGENHRNVGIALSQAGMVAFSAGEYRSSRAYLAKALGIVGAGQSADPLAVSKILNSLSAVHQELGDYDEAEKNGAEAIRIRRKLNSPDEDDLASPLTNYAGVKWHLGDTAEAYELYQEVLSLRENSGQKDEKGIISALLNSGAAAAHLGLYDQAETLLRKALGKARKLDDPNQISAALIRIGDLNWFRKKYVLAEESYGECLGIRIDTLGKKHAEVGRCLVRRGRSRLASFKNEEAEKDLRKGISILSEALGETHPDLLESSLLLAICCEKLGKSSESDSALESHLGILYNAFNQVAGYAPESERLSFLRRINPFNGPILLGRPDLLKECSARLKNSIIESLAREKQTEARLSGVNSDLFGRIRSLRMQVYQTGLKSGETDTALIAMKAELESLEREAARLSPYTPGGSAFTILPDEAVLDIFSYQTNPAIHGSVESYAMGIYRSDGEELHLLGSREKIDGLVADYRGTMNAVPGDRYSEMPLNQRRQLFASVHHELSDMLLEPLGGKIPKNLMVCGDGSLHFVDYFTLFLPKCEKIVGAISIVRIIDSIRLPPVKRTKGGVGSILFVCNPDFGSDSPLASLVQVEGDRSRSFGIFLGQLQGTVEEVKRLQTIASSNNFNSTVQSYGEATEARFWEEIRDYSVIHIATHGFYLKGIFGENERPRNPMALSGLAFAGAQTTLNQWIRGNFPDPANDGIVSASEVAQADLSGTRLVVLSACETALGATENGDGVVGLRRAMMLSGANEMIMTLWVVSDHATVELMEMFYKDYFRSSDPLASLTRVKRTLYEKWLHEHDMMTAISFVGPFIHLNQ